MATLSRSSRRPEDNALHHHHHIVGRPTATHHLMATSAARANTAAAALATQNQNILSRGASGRVKRALDATDCDPDDKVITKRSRITVDIPARVVNTGGTVGGSGGTGGSGGNDGPAGSGDLAGSGTVLQKGAPPSQRARGQKQQAVQQAGPPAAADHCKVDPPTENKARHASGTRPPDKRRRIDASKTDNPDKLTKSQEKVRNGIQHELDRLQPASADAKPEGRKLRSQETIRFKSELSTYFPEYDEVIGNDPKQSHLLNLETPIIIVESAHPPPETSETAKTNARKRPVKEQASNDTGSLTDNLNIVQHYGDALFDDLYDSQRIDFGFLEARLKKKLPEDPLLDTYYEPTHKKSERTEKSIRNRERGRAQHERDRIIRLLDGLQGHDWLRIMGVSGITESRKKSFEPARDYFIKGCQAILDKFRRWTLEEKRRKLDRERKEAEQSEPQPASGMLRSGSSAPRAEDEPSGAGDDASVVSDPNSDVDASIAKQLHEEALARAQVAAEAAAVDGAASEPTKASSETKQPAKRLRGKAAAAKPTAASTSKTSAARKPAEPVATKPPKEFTSFFKKKHERDAALSRGRRSGRKILAWGLPLPDMPEADFDLPDEFKDFEGANKGMARKKRRDKRATRV